MTETDVVRHPLEMYGGPGRWTVDVSGERPSFSRSIGTVLLCHGDNRPARLDA